MIRATHVTTAAVVGATFLVSPLAAQDRPGHYGGQAVIRASLGEFGPEGDSEYWIEKETDFFGTTSGFDDVTLSADLVYFVSARVGLLASVGGWEGNQTQSYRDFVDPGGFEIEHLTTVDEAWLDVGLVVHLLSVRAPIMPYVGGGGSFISWELVEEGEFIDFSSAEPTIFADAFSARGESLGYFLLAGLEVPLGERISLFGEARWRSAEDELSDDFAGLGTLDLSGRSVSVGISVAF